jgi:hypothetical protein
MQLVEKKRNLHYKEMFINFILIQTAQGNVSNKVNIHTVTSHRTKIQATGSD